MRSKPICLALALAVSMAAPFASHAEQDKAATLTVSLARPAERLWPRTISASGWLKPWHEAIVAAEVNGLRVTEILVDVGSVVSKGQPLARFADETVRTELRKEEALLASARAELAKARLNADRAQRLQTSGTLAESKIEEYLLAEQTAVAGVESAEASVESTGIKLAQTTVVAADDGVITARSAQLGAVVTSGTELFRLVRQQRVEWQAEFSAQYLPLVTEGLTVTIDGPEGGLIGHVRLVAPTVSTDTGRALVYVALPAGAQIPVGLYVRGRIELEKTVALTVPESALVMRDGISYVFTLDTDRRVVRIRVETGRRNGREVEILSGLNSATDIVSRGGAFLSDKARVRIEGEVLAQAERAAR
ncbi:efflux RND transporter periplasmic adaptor subunit [Rhizobium yanglingense]